MDAVTLADIVEGRAYGRKTRQTSKLALENSIIVEGRTKLLEFPVPKALRPSAWLQLKVLIDTDVQRTSIHLDTLEAESALEVQVRGPKEDQRPGATAQIQMKVQDRKGEQPRVSASVAVVDEAIFQLVPEMLPDVLRTLHPEEASPSEDGWSILMGQGVVCEGFQQDFILHTLTKDRTPRPSTGSTRIDPPPPGITTGAIRGSVTDVHGRSIAGAEVVLESPVLPYPYTYRCYESGGYAAELLPVGTYTVRCARRLLSGIVEPACFPN